MEQAVFIAGTQGMRRVTQGYTRLYFGSEFCERRIPTPDEMKTVAGFVKERRLAFTLVTPYVTDRGIGALEGVIDTVSAIIPDFEVVINDWGVLRMLRRKPGRIEFVLGRLLTKQKRDPRTETMERWLPERAVQHFRESNVDTPEFRDFLAGLGIRRVELDNLTGGIRRQKGVLPASLHVPFAYVTTTRFCPAASCEKQSIPFRRIGDCAFECRGYTFSLRHPDMPRGLLLKGNTQFFRNDRLPDDLEALNIDRLVHAPEIPV